MITSPARDPAPVENARRHRWLTAGTAVAGCAALAGYLYVVDPNNPSSAYPQCPLKAMTGVDCPGCGGLRATYALVHGDLAGALSHNVLAAIAVPVIAYLVVRYVLAQFDITWPSIRLPRWSAVAIPMFVLAFTILRNVSWAPFWYFNSAA